MGKRPRWVQSNLDGLLSHMVNSIWIQKVRPAELLAGWTAHVHHWEDQAAQPVCVGGDGATRGKQEEFKNTDAFLLSLKQNAHC